MCLHLLSILVFVSIVFITVSNHHTTDCSQVDLIELEKKIATKHIGVGPIIVELIYYTRKQPLKTWDWLQIGRYAMLTDSSYNEWTCLFT